ncbi:MAG: HDIG domain-containing protein [Treponema sp.]|nr:HDIG domain-containing protein [Treponema sp.]
MKANRKKPEYNIKETLIGIFNPSRFKSRTFIFSFSLCIIGIIIIITSGNNDAVVDITNFEAGKVADRDIVAGFTVTFTDEEATLLRMENITRQVPAVFRFSAASNMQIMEAWNSFCNLTGRFSNEESEQARLAIETEYPAGFPIEILDAYLASDERADFRNYGVKTLETLLKQGVFLFHREDVRHFNPDVAELQNNEGQTQQVYIAYNDIITMANVQEALGSIARSSEAPILFKAIAVDLLKPFVMENVFFSLGESQRRIDEAKAMTTPVIRSIEEGKRIIRKGFVITEAEMQELEFFYLSSPRRDPKNIIGTIFMVLLIYILLVILQKPLIIGKELSDSERYLLATIAGVYIIGAVLLNNVSLGFDAFPVSLLMPTALFIMILAVLMGTRIAMIMALAMPLGAFFCGGFDFYSYLIALMSAAAASTVLHNAKNRMSLVKAGLIIAASNCFAVIVVLLIRQAGIYDYPILILTAALNGVICGMLTLGVLPPLEHALNAVTPFRLMELSDLNAPILRKLFTAASGTYSHSLMVANLAEQACQDIGADALLARVGAYYHDIGKIDNPDYFVENQTDHNRHDEIAPRLSATIIRSHVKLGVEKAYSLGLPKAVIDIIAEHHGNSVISWFYNKAAEQEEGVNSDDFTYSGTPPHTKESAVVMLADISEAAVRTLNKPTVGKIDKFIQQLFDAKIEHGQLSASDLSFNELEVIKNAFVKVLAGYYHSRIEYPKQKEES